MATEGLRQRPGKGKGKGKGEGKEASRSEMLWEVSQGAPAAVRPLAEKMIPVVVAVWAAAEAAVPFALLAQAKAEAGYKLMEPYHPEDLLPALCGLAMVFFGGDFPMLIATIVAFKETGTWASMQSAFLQISGEAQQVLKASQSDDAADGDGGADVTQISAKEVVQRKLLLAAKTVDPDKLGAAVTQGSAGSLAVVASLKLSFARTLSLGASLGGTLYKPVSRKLTPLLQASLDDEYHKWIQPGLGYGCKVVAMALAFWVQRIISAVHSAVAGGQMCTTSTCRYLNKYKVIAFDPDTSHLDELAGYGLAVAGLYCQLFYGTPFLLSLLLLPLTVAEWAIQFALSFA